VRQCAESTLLQHELVWGMLWDDSYAFSMHNMLSCVSYEYIAIQYPPCWAITRLSVF